MPRDPIAYQLAQENAAQIDGMCVLCRVGIPGGKGRFEQCHHIAVKGMGGTKSEFILSDERNMAPTCRAHHDKYQPNRYIWVAAMTIALGYDYADTPLSSYRVDNPREYLKALKGE